MVLTRRQQAPLPPGSPAMPPMPNAGEPVQDEPMPLAPPPGAEEPVEPQLPAQAQAQAPVHPLPPGSPHLSHVSLQGPGQRAAELLAAAPPHLCRAYLNAMDAMNDIFSARVHRRRNAARRE